MNLLMGDILKAVYEDYLNYTELCKKFGEEPQEKGPYNGHLAALRKKEREKNQAIHDRLKKALAGHRGVADVRGMDTAGKLFVYAETNNLGRHLKKVVSPEFEGIPVEIVGPNGRPIS